MREVPVLAINAGSEVVLEPGSYHLMLMMPVGELKPDQLIRIEMHTADDRVFSFDLPIARR